MKKYVPWTALLLLLATLVYALHTRSVDQHVVRACYRTLLPEAASFDPLTDTIAAARDASGATLGYVGVSSHVGYGGPMLVGVVVRPDGSLSEPVIFSHKETQAYLHNIRQQGFFRQFEKHRADDALTPGFDVDAVSGATLSSNAIALSVNEVAHTVAVRALELTPRKAELPVRAGLPEFALAALFVLGLLASMFKKLAGRRLLLLSAGVVILGFWLNRSFSLAYVLAACMGFFPSLAQNPGWYVVIAGALLPPLILGKNIYCAFVCPFCGLQELAHRISRVNLPAGSLLKALRPLRFVFLFAALFIGFLFLNPSCGSYEPFGTAFGLNGEDFNWYLLFVALVAAFFFHRFWCHMFCPAGALLDFVASKRRSAGKRLCGKKNCPSEAKCGAACPSGGTRRASGLPEAPAKAAPAGGAKARPTKAQILFLILYAAGVFCIVWTVWANIRAH